MSTPFKLPLFTGDEDHRGIYNAERPVAVSMTYGPKGAAHIVRCVNAHAALVAALRTLVARFNSGDMNAYQEPFSGRTAQAVLRQRRELADALNREIEIATAALALAEGR